MQKLIINGKSANFKCCLQILLPWHSQLKYCKKKSFIKKNLDAHDFLLCFKRNVDSVYVTSLFVKKRNWFLEDSFLVLPLPCKYLGVPLSPHKLTKAQAQPIIEKIADRLPSWKADLLTKAGRSVLVQYVLTSMLIYLVLALDLPIGTLQAIDKIRRGFLWKGRKDTRGGHCLIAWPKVTRPPELGGLGISDLQRLGWALRLRWLWLQKTEPEKPWAFFPINSSPQVKAFFAAAIISEVGNGKNTCFWTDRWLGDQSLQKSFPNLFRAVAARARKRKVFQALNNRTWVSDIRGALTVQVLLSYVELQPDVEDTHIWTFSTTGQYTTKSAYEALFIGAIQFGPRERIWRSWAPSKCKFFLWTAAHKRCWTADQPARITTSFSLPTL